MDDAEFSLFLMKFDQLVNKIDKFWKKYPQLKHVEEAAEHLTLLQLEIYAERIQKARDMSLR